MTLHMSYPKSPSVWSSSCQTEFIKRRLLGSPVRKFALHWMLFSLDAISIRFLIWSKESIFHVTLDWLPMQAIDFFSHRCLMGSNSIIKVMAKLLSWNVSIDHSSGLMLLDFFPHFYLHLKYLNYIEIFVFPFKAKG